jgi:hypothetical protein
VRRTHFAVLVRNHAWNQESRFDYSEKFCGENRPNETWKPFDLWLQGDHIIAILAQKAGDGNANAALELARLASLATWRLTRICKAKPELVRTLARLRRAWPVIKKRNAKLSEEEKELFARIQLGADDFIELDPQTARWKFDDAGKIAYSLLDYIRRARKSSKDSIFSCGTVGKVAKEKLKDFDDESAPQWWTFAKEILLFSYPEPHVIEELNGLIPASSRKRKSPGRMKQAILEKLRARFLSFPRNASYQS